jgi:hypothetical protein
MTSTQVLDIFRLFPATRSLYVSKDLVPLVAPALQELIGERTTEVLPNLCDLFLRGSAKSRSIKEFISIHLFVNARQFSGRPVAIHYLEEAQRVVQ